ncbi:hypothetical protein O988_03519, partial [Pseudogymnoascus sp. VKM F-3808]
MASQSNTPEAARLINSSSVHAKTPIEAADTPVEKVELEPPDVDYTQIDLGPYSGFTSPNRASEFTGSGTTITEQESPDAHKQKSLPKTPSLLGRCVEHVLPFHRFQSSANGALQETVEAFLVSLLEDRAPTSAPSAPSVSPSSPRTSSSPRKGPWKGSFQSSAIGALQETVEAFLVSLFEDRAPTSAPSAPSMSPSSPRTSSSPRKGPWKG